MLLPGPPGVALNTQAAGGMYPDNRSIAPSKGGNAVRFSGRQGHVPVDTARVTGPCLCNCVPSSCLVPAWLDPARMTGPCPCNCVPDWTLPARPDPARVNLGLAGPCLVVILRVG